MSKVHRIALPCAECGVAVAMLDVAAVTHAAKLAGMGGFPAATLLAMAGRKARLYCSMCEPKATGATPAPARPAPTLPGLG